MRFESREKLIKRERSRWRRSGAVAQWRSGAHQDFKAAGREDAGLNVRRGHAANHTVVFWRQNYGQNCGCWAGNGRTSCLEGGCQGSVRGAPHNPHSSDKARTAACSTLWQQQRRQNDGLQRERRLGQQARQLGRRLDEDRQLLVRNRMPLKVQDQPPAEWRGKRREWRNFRIRGAFCCCGCGCRGEDEVRRTSRQARRPRSCRTSERPEEAWG